MAAKKILVLAPHTDDGELGCGASIHRFIEAGDEVVYVAFSICKDSLPEGFAEDTLATEVKLATSILGIKEENLLLLDFPVRQFDLHRQTILNELLLLRQKYMPTKIFLPLSSDVHQDHGVIHNEAIRAFKHCSIYGYEMPWNNYSFSGNNFITISQLNLDAKKAALAAYQSQQQRAYMQPDFTTSLAVVRGIQAGSQYAECFEAIRIIE